MEPNINEVLRPVEGKENNLRYDFGTDIKQAWNIIVSPNETFKYINEQPTWWLPLTILILISIAYILITFPSIIIPEKINSIMSNPAIQNLSEAQKTKLLTTSNILIRSIVGAIISTPIYLLLKAAIFYFTVVVTGYEIKFKKIFSLTVWSGIITSLGVIVKTLLTIMKHSSQVYTSLAVFLPGMNNKSVLFAFLNNFEIFTLWNLALIGVGIGVITKMDKKKSTTLVFVLWLLWVIINTFILRKFGAGATV